MSSKWFVVSVAGLGYNELFSRGLTRMGGLQFFPAKTVFPAVTCTAQASFRTASLPREHGIVSNGVFSRSMRRAELWNQSAELVQGGRIWDDARKSGKSVGMFFWQQSLGENIDFVFSPAPIHKHGGGMIMDCLSHPAGLSDVLRKKCGMFPLHKYWGPLAHPSVGNKVLDTVSAFFEIESASADIVFLYLPTLDYDLQRYGTADRRTEKSFAILKSQIERIAQLAERDSRQLLVFGDYAISDVTLPAAFPNLTLKNAGLLTTRAVKNRLYPNLFHSRAFAMVDHEIAHVYVKNPEDITTVKIILGETGDYDEVIVRKPEYDWAHDVAGDILLVARKGSWIAYPWWSCTSEAPDFASHVDIHSKPGYDPGELFFDRSSLFSISQDTNRIKGTHGRNEAPIAFASTSSLNIASEPSIVSIAECLSREFIK